MYLTMLSNESSKLAFLEMAYLLSITDIKKDGEVYVEEYELGWLFSSGTESEENLKLLKKILLRKESEQGVLKLYAEEMNVFNLEDDEKGRIDSRLIDFVDNMLKRFLAEVKTTNEKILNNQSMRVEFVKDTVKALVDEGEITKISPEEKKVMIFELAGMACADGEVSDAEEEVIRYVCDIFDVDFEFVEDAKDIVMSMVNLQQKGLELINE